MTLSDFCCLYGLVGYHARLERLGFLSVASLRCVRIYQQWSLSLSKLRLLCFQRASKKVVDHRTKKAKMPARSGRQLC